MGGNSVVHAARASRTSVAALLSLALVLSSTPLTKADSKASSPTEFLVLQFGGSVEDWLLASSAEGPHPVSGEWIWRGKFTNSKTQRVAGVVTDAEGRVIGLDNLYAEAAAAWAARDPWERKADGALRSMVNRTEDLGISQDVTIPVGIWIAADVRAAVDQVLVAHPGYSEFALAGAEPAQIVQVESELDAARATVYREVQDYLAPAIESLDGRIAYRSTAAPLIFVDIPASSVRALAELPEVQLLGLEGQWYEALDHARPTVHGPWVETQGYTGSGVEVGVIEYHTVRQQGGLAGTVGAYYNATANDNTTCHDSNPLDHPTWVAGAIASQLTSYRGLAPGATLLSGATCTDGPSLPNDRKVVEAADWALSQGASILNLSLVQDTGDGHAIARTYFDSVVHQNHDMVVAATGNLNDCGTDTATNNERVGSPGVGWNVLTVGGIDDGNNSDWSNDVLWYKPGGAQTVGACWVDQDGTDWNPGPDYDFNKPDVSAPAADVQTANGERASGTSVATPIVSGIAATMIGRAPGSLESRPDAVKAMIMAGAINQVPLPNGNASTDHQGVGTVSGRWAHRALDEGGGTYGGYIKSQFTQGQYLYTTSFNVSLDSNVQVALVWDSHTSGSDIYNRTDFLGSDLDLEVVRPDGGSLYSYSANNASEFVKFTAGTPGTVTIRVKVWRQDVDVQQWAVAWIEQP